MVRQKLRELSNFLYGNLVNTQNTHEFFQYFLPFTFLRKKTLKILKITLSLMGGSILVKIQKLFVLIKLRE